jgi:DNA-binding MarR family transcriptional regulator
MKKRALNKFRYIFRDFNMTLGLFRTPVYPGMKLSYAELTFLLFLYEKPSIRLEELADYFRVNKSSISRKLSTLEKNGLITRHIVPGKSQSIGYELTEKAIKQIEATVIRSNDFLELMQSYMGEDHFKAFFKLMITATDAINQIRKDHKDIY